MNFIILLATIIIVALAVALLSIKLILSKKAKFPHTHVGGNPSMQERGIACHTSQHRDAQAHRSLAERLSTHE